MRKLVFIICGFLLLSCTNTNPVGSFNKAEFVVYTECYDGYYRTWIQPWGPLEESLVVKFNDKTASKTYPMTSYFNWLTPSFHSDVYSQADTLNYSIDYCGERYQAAIVIGEQISYVKCNGINTTITYNSSITSPQSSPPQSRDTVARSLNYTFVLNENAVYIVTVISYYDTKGVNIRDWIDTLVTGDSFTFKLDSVVLVDMLIRKYSDYSWVDFSPMYSGKTFLIYHETAVDRKNLYLFLR
jgi:hypothetical protein